MPNVMQTGGYHQDSMDTPLQTPDSGSKFSHPKSGRISSPPLVHGYFTPPDSHENSPALGGTSPNPQDDISSTLQQSTLKGSPDSPASLNGGITSVQNFGKIISESWLPATPPSIPLNEESFRGLQSILEQTKSTLSSVVQISGFQSTHGTFGRVDSRRYQGNNVVGSPQSPKSIPSSNHRYQNSNASTIVPLPSTVYEPDVRDRMSTTASLDMKKGRYHYGDHRRERSMSEPKSHFSWTSHTPSLSASSTSISSPFLPLEPDSPATPAPRVSQPYRRSSLVSSQAELIGLWKSAQSSGKIARNLSDGGRIYVLNMYRQPSFRKSRVANHPLVSPEHFTFGPNSQTAFYTMHAMRENPEDDAFNELSFLRRDPISDLDTSVITLGLEPPSRRTSPAGDGLVALIYPKEAILSAMSPIAPTQDKGETLNRRKTRDTEERVGEAIQRAYATECCRLGWNVNRRRYYLYHPGAADGGDAYLVEIEGEVGFDRVGANGTIKLINVDTNEVFTELDFARGKLFIDTRATSKIPSDHIVDVAVTTILTVAIVEGRRARSIQMIQSQFSMPAISRPLNGKHRRKKLRGCFSAFFKSLCH